MNAARRELFEGLGLAVLALFFTGMLLYAAFVGAQKGDFGRAAIFGLPGLVALYWSARFARAQFAAYAAASRGERGG